MAVKKAWNAKQFAELLMSLDACSEEVEWASGKTMDKAWKECTNPSWMLWLLGKSQVNKKVIATIAVEFAEMCVHNASGYPAVAECIKITKAFLSGKVTSQELDAAESAAEPATTRYAESAARYAAWYAARSARYAARSARYAARSARYAARSAEYATTRSAESAARYAAESATTMSAEPAARYAAWSAASDIVRKHVPDITKFFA